MSIQQYIVWVELEAYDPETDRYMDVTPVSFVRAATFGTHKRARAFGEMLLAHAESLLESGDWA